MSEPPMDLPRDGFTWRLRRAIGFTDRCELNQLLIEAATLERNLKLQTEEASYQAQMKADALDALNKTAEALARCQK